MGHAEIAPAKSMRRRDFGVSHSRLSAHNISDAASPAPNLRHRLRNGRSVTPAMGASTMLDDNMYGPIRSVMALPAPQHQRRIELFDRCRAGIRRSRICLLYTYDAADE